MDGEKQLKEYRHEQSMKLFDAYKDLIGKTWDVIDKDLLQEKIDDDEDEKQTEQRFLDAIQKRRKALDEVDVMLDKIEKIEKSMNNDSADRNDEESLSSNDIKDRATKRRQRQAP